MKFVDEVDRPIMYTLREQFEGQHAVASATANFKSIELDLVMVRRKGFPTRISILGSAINRAAYGQWRAAGSNVRLLCVIGQKIN